MKNYRRRLAESMRALRSVVLKHKNKLGSRIVDTRLTKTLSLGLEKHSKVVKHDEIVCGVVRRGGRLVGGTFTVWYYKGEDGRAPKEAAGSRLDPLMPLGPCDVAGAAYPVLWVLVSDSRSPSDCFCRPAHNSNDHRHARLSPCLAGSVYTRLIHPHTPSSCEINYHMILIVWCRLGRISWSGILKHSAKESWYK